MPQKIHADWPVALAARLLSVVLLHFDVQATVKILVISGDASLLFPIVWMAASAVLPMSALRDPRPFRA